MASPLAAIILSGGASTRMGRDKASIVVDAEDGATLLERTVSAARAAGATQVVVVGDQPGTATPDARFVREDPPLSGPVAALDTALAEIDADRVLVLPCDLAHPWEAARELVRAAGEDCVQTEHDGVVAVDSTGRRQHLTALFRTAALRLTAIPGTTRVRERVSGLDLIGVPEPADRPGIWDDMDTPEDVDRHRSHANGSPTPPPGAPVSDHANAKPNAGGSQLGIKNDIPGLREWLDTVADELQLPASVVVPGPLLDVARDVARGVIRPGAPTTTYLIGVAVGLQLAGEERSPEDVAELVDRLSDRVQDLALGYNPPKGQR